MLGIKCWLSVFVLELEINSIDSSDEDKRSVKIEKDVLPAPDDFNIL